MDPRTEHLSMTRRQLFGRGAVGLGAAALATLLGRDALAVDLGAAATLLHVPHFAPKAKRVIYHYSAGPVVSPCPSAI